MYGFISFKFEPHEGELRSFMFSQSDSLKKRSNLAISSCPFCIDLLH